MVLALAIPRAVLLVMEEGLERGGNSRRCGWVVRVASALSFSTRGAAQRECLGAAAYDAQGICVSGLACGDPHLYDWWGLSMETCWGW